MYIAYVCKHILETQESFEETRTRNEMYSNKSSLHQHW